MTQIMHFNPTATAIQFDGSNQNEIDSLLREQNVTSAVVPQKGDWMVIFMGQTLNMTDAQLNAAMGRL